jgi:hypothetical protein
MRAYWETPSGLKHVADAAIIRKPIHPHPLRRADCLSGRLIAGRCATHAEAQDCACPLWSARSASARGRTPRGESCMMDELDKDEGPP